MILTKELLKRYDACTEGIEFCERNKLFGFDLERIGEVSGDYCGFITWLMLPRSFDADSRTLTVENYAGLCVTIEYDSAGNKIRKRQANGEWIKWGYDEIGNKITFENSRGYWIKWEYDEMGNKVKKTQANGDWFKYEYDERGNKIREEYINGLHINYEYDEVGNMICERYLSGGWITFKHDANGNIIKEEGVNGGIISTITELYPNGQLKRIDDLHIPLI